MRAKKQREQIWVGSSCDALHEVSSFFLPGVHSRPIASPAVSISVRSGRLAKRIARHSSFSIPLQYTVRFGNPMAMVQYTQVVRAVHETAPGPRGNVQHKFDRRRPCEGKFMVAKIV